MPVNRETERLAEQFRREMGGRKVSIKGLAELLSKTTDKATNEMWVSRRVNGVAVLYEPPRPAQIAPEVEDIRAALGISRVQIAEIIGITVKELDKLLPEKPETEPANSGAR